MKTCLLNEISRDVPFCMGYWAPTHQGRGPKSCLSSVTNEMAQADALSTGCFVLFYTNRTATGKH
jgi:hypothetical protein